MPAPTSTCGAPPLLVLHGFPTSSIDFASVLPSLREGRRVVLVDLPGYGQSAKPDRAVLAVRPGRPGRGAARPAMGIDGGRPAHPRHGRLRRRRAAGPQPRRHARLLGAVAACSATAASTSTWPTSPRASSSCCRCPTRRSTRTSAPDVDALSVALTATFAPAGSPASHPDLDHVRAAADLIVVSGGNRLLPRLIRYIEERRKHEDRWTGAIERHPAPLTVVWGDLDPIAVWEMTGRAGRAARPTRR